MANDKRKRTWDEWKLILRRIGFTVSFLAVAGVAARVSYGHIRDVVLHVGQPTDVAYLLPLSVDGLMLIATLAMAEDKANSRHPRGWARWGFWFGAAISTAANVQAVIITSGVDPLGIAVGAAAPVLLLWSIEIVARPGKPRLVTAVQNAVSAAIAAVMPATIPVQEVATLTTPDAAPVAVDTVPETVPVESAPVADPEPVNDEPVKPVKTRRRSARNSKEAQARTERAYARIAEEKAAAESVTHEAVTDAVDVVPAG